MKNEGARVVTTLYSYILDAQVQLTVVGGRLWWIIKLNRAQVLWVSLLPTRMRKIHSKMKVLEWSQNISNVSICRFFYDAQVS